MLKQTCLAVSLLVAAPQAAFAHSSGHGSIKPEEALLSAVDAVGYLAARKVDREWSPLPQSWAGLGSSSAKLLAVLDGDYVISVTNDEEGRVFYLLIGNNGALLDANYTGTFPYVWDLETDGADAQKD